MNKFLLAGEVIGISDDEIRMMTVERTVNGEYPDEHVILFDETPDVKLGQRVQLVGEIGQDADNPRELCLNAKAENVLDYDKKIDHNIARVSGIMHRGFEYFPPIPDENKKGFGNLLLVVNDEFYIRGAVLTNPAAMKMDRDKKFTTGTEVQIEGRLQTREFEQNGEERVAIEIVVNADKTKVIKSAESVDLFEEYDELMKAAI